MKANNRSFGAWGEKMAEEYLKQKKYKFIDRNFNSHYGEIDLIFFDKLKNELVFVEVKTRCSQNFGYPEDSINPKKIDHLQKTINFFLEKNIFFQKYSYRLDVIAIELGENKKTLIKHLENIALV